MADIVIGTVEEIPPGHRRIVDNGGRSIGVFNIDGTFHAVRNRCPHQGVEICKGQLGGTFLPSRPQEFIYGLHGCVLTCPAHRWQFDLTTGRSISEPSRIALKTYDVFVEDGKVIVRT